MPSEVHRAAAEGFARAAGAYERGRPGFPPEAIAALIEELGLAPRRSVLDLGAGTGKLTRLLEPAGARIIAIEPVGEMRAALRARSPRVDVIGATAEHLPLRPGAADAVVAAQAFHWFDGAAALGELARVLPADAPFALVWNVRDESTSWVAELTDLIEPYRGDTPSHRSMRWLGAFDDDPRWLPPERRSFGYTHETTREATVDRVLSISFIAALDTEEQDAVADRVRATVPPGDVVRFPYRTDVWITRRR